ncbi:hypothetical protein K1719_028914 [Acacia pycnantha]|nr:hypothetical protein K1719_028914 [Acacia pycnantha]
MMPDQPAISTMTGWLVVWKMDDDTIQLPNIAIVASNDTFVAAPITAALLLISFIGSKFNFLTLVYTFVLLSLSVPPLYDKYQDHIDDKLYMIHRKIRTLCGKLDNNPLRKILLPSNKAKKME